MTSEAHLVHETVQYYDCNTYIVLFFLFTLNIDVGSISMTKLVHDNLKEKPNLLLCTVRGCCFPVRDLLFAWFASTCSPIKKVYAKDDTVYLSDHCYGIGFFRMTMQIDVLDISFYHHHHKSTKQGNIAQKNGFHSSIRFSEIQKICAKAH